MSSTYAQTETFIQGNRKEGIVFTVTDALTGAAIDITGANKIEFRCFDQSFKTIIFQGSMALGEIDETYGASNQCRFAPDAGDMDTPGTFLGELFIEFSDTRESRIQDIIIIIKPKAPTS